MLRTLMILICLALTAAGCRDSDGSKPGWDLGDLSVADAALLADANADLPDNLQQIYNAVHPGCTNIDAAWYQAQTAPPTWTAARLTPPSYPFTVVQVSYKLWSKNNNSSIKTCDAHIPHKVAVWVGDKTTPEASPTLAFSKDVPKWDSPLTMVLREVKLTLDKPIQLKSGEHLFVAVLVQRDPANAALTMCLQGCFDEKLSERSFYSEELSAPFTWEDMLTKNMTLTTAALGYEG